MSIAVIPARGGSKRIPGKNVKAFCGKPMLAWSIAAARESGCFERVVVSTDSDEIAAVARRFGAEVLARPAELADDHTGTIPVIAHAVRELGATGAVCCVYATAPFLQAGDIRRGLVALNGGDWSYAFTATDFAAPVFRSFERLDGGGVRMFFPEKFPVRSQDLPTAFHDAGQFYWGTAEAWLEGRPFFAPHSTMVLVPRWRVQDIDTLDDWARAELIAPGILELNERMAA